MKIIESSVSLEWITPNAVEMIERAARTCYKSECVMTPAERQAFIRRVVHQNHHESVVEHASASFRIICDRGISHEIVRHRLASYSQESTRYVNYTKDKHGAGEFLVICPTELTPCEQWETHRDHPNRCPRCKLHHAWRGTIGVAEVTYKQLITAGITPQIARSVLPTCLKTELVMTANFREWMHFIKLRTSGAAHPQMQIVAKKIEAILIEQCPEVFDHD